MSRLRLACLTACCSLLAAGLAFSPVACGSKDDGGSTPTDSGPTDAKVDVDPLPRRDGGTVEITVLNGDKTADIAADLSCMGKPPVDSGLPDIGSDTGADAGADVSGDAPVDETGPDAVADAATDAPPAPVPPGTMIDVPFKILEFSGGSSDIVVSAKVDIFYKATLVPDTPDLSGTTDSKGIYLAKLPASMPFAYRVLQNTALRTFVDYSAEAPSTPGKTLEGTAITRSKYDQFALAITGKSGFLTAPGTGIFSARVKDCKGRDVRNAIVTLVDGATGAPLPTPMGDTGLWPVHYLTDNELPSVGETITSRSGLVAAVNVPKTSPTVKIKAIASGLYGGSLEIRKFAEADLEITEAAVNFRYVQPK